MSKVYANGRTVVHKGDGLVTTDALPDVCKTPSPGGPIPVPYVNIARDGDLADASKSVTIEGNSVALKDSNLSTSSGDEPGTAGGGVISSKTKGKMTWASASIDVKIEGKGVVRFLEATQHNGNTFNSAFIHPGATGFAYGDDRDPTGPCRACEQPKEEHRIFETENTKASTQELVKKTGGEAHARGGASAKPPAVRIHTGNNEGQGREHESALLSSQVARSENWLGAPTTKTG